MSYVILKKGKIAKNPYYMANLKTKLFSVEELCYFIYSNVSLCDEALDQKGLSEWLSEQCGLGDLGQSLEALQAKGARVDQLAAQVFSYTDYLSARDRDAVCERIRKYAQLSRNERLKMRGDYYFMESKYLDAIKIYEDMLLAQSYDDDKMQHQLIYNVGCCYSNMFYFDMAFDWFIKAADLQKDKANDYLAALMCKRLQLDPDQYETFLRENPQFELLAADVEREIDASMAEWEQEPGSKQMLTMLSDNTVKNAEYYDYIDACLTEWKGQI